MLGERSQVRGGGKVVGIRVPRANGKKELDGRSGAPLGIRFELLAVGRIKTLQRVLVWIAQGAELGSGKSVRLAPVHLRQSSAKLRERSLLGVLHLPRQNGPVDPRFGDQPRRWPGRKRLRKGRQTA